LSGVLNDCEYISLLELSNNELTSLRDFFVRNNQLTRFFLDNNRLGHIQQADLTNLSNSEELSLSHNNIELIDEKAFDHLVSLQKLNLERNNLKW
jgi:Leucine-rich repeat (LRR) protein